MSLSVCSSEASSSTLSWSSSSNLHLLQTWSLGRTLGSTSSHIIQKPHITCPSIIHCNFYVKKIFPCFLLWLYWEKFFFFFFFLVFFQTNSPVLFSLKPFLILSPINSLCFPLTPLPAQTLPAVYTRPPFKPGADLKQATKNKVL